MSTGHEDGQDAERADFAVGSAAAVLGVAALALIPSEVSRDAFGSLGNVRSPAFFPLLASALLILFSAALLVRGWQRRGPRAAGIKLPPARVFAVAGLLAGAGVAVTTLGFAPTAFALIVGLSYAFGARSHATVLGLALTVPATIQVLFTSFLDVLLPRGVLF